MFWKLQLGKTRCPGTKNSTSENDPFGPLFHFYEASKGG